VEEDLADGFCGNMFREKALTDVAKSRNSVIRGQLHQVRRGGQIHARRVRQRVRVHVAEHRAEGLGQDALGRSVEPQRV
jgi:hypothetical protein